MSRSARREALFTAAEQIIVVHGQGALTMDRLAREGGVSNALIYQHFSSRADVLQQLLETYWREYDQQLEKVRESSATTEDWLRGIFEVFLDMRRRRPAFARLQGERSIEPTVEAIRLERLTSGFDQWAEFFAKNHRLSPSAARLAVGMVFGALTGALDYSTYESADPDDIVGIALSFARSGLDAYARNVSYTIK